MAKDVLVDTSFVIALLSNRDAYHRWAVAQASEFPPPWITCEAVMSEAFHLIGPHGASKLAALITRRSLIATFRFRDDVEPVVKFIEKYSNVPMGFADACLVRMTETLSDPVLLTIDSDFRIYRRHSRQMVPCVTPP